ncbi:uncharacterized protein LOC135462903 [Liolophura sinensis]|uniref:uncharacterized protein LOC135462903 n=1 Tax=Liolophura sinensis TaxID=3198878 RepID=UPI0031587356
MLHIPFRRRNYKIFLVVLCFGVFLLWQLLTVQPVPPKRHYVGRLDTLYPTVKRRLRTLRKQPDIIHLNHSSIVLSDDQSPAQVEENFFRYIESKDVRCAMAQRLGHPHDGGWNVCLSPPYGLKKPCIVFSFGINNDWQFDEAVSILYKCKVYSYDPSMNMQSHDRGEHIHFEPTGLGGRDETNHNGWKLRTFHTYLINLDLTEKAIDYLKFDIEYSEWSALETMATDGSLENVRQIGFEIHTPELFRAFKMNIPSKKHDYLKMYQTLAKLEEIGFRRYDHRRNPFGEFRSNISGIVRACCYELYYLNMKYYTEHQQEMEHDKRVVQLFDDG